MSLDAVRKVHAQAVELLMMELSRIAQTLTRSEGEYRSMEIQIQKDAEVYALLTTQGLTIEALLEWQGKMSAQRGELQEARVSIDRMTALWQETQERLIQARQECKLLERVMERRQAAVRAVAVRQEQRAVDEAAHRQVSVRGGSES